MADAAKINQNFSILEGRIGGSGGTVNYENYQYAFKAIDVGRNVLAVQNVSYDVVVFDVVSFKDHRVVQVKMPYPRVYDDFATDDVASSTVARIGVSEIRHGGSSHYPTFISSKPASVSAGVSSSYVVSQTGEYTAEKWEALGDYTTLTIYPRSAAYIGTISIGKRGGASMQCSEYSTPEAHALMPITDEPDICFTMVGGYNNCQTSREDLLASHQAAIDKCEEESYLQHKFSTILTGISISASILIDDETALTLTYSATNLPSGQTQGTGPLGCYGDCGDVPLGARDFSPYANEAGLLPQKSYRESVIDDLLGILDYIVISDGG